MRLKSVSINTGIKRLHPDLCSERSLAAAILKQAWQEAVNDLLLINETSRADYSRLKEEAIEWICNDNKGFLYWCQLADVDHTEVRQRLMAVLRSQHYSSRATCPQ